VDRGLYLDRIFRIYTKFRTLAERGRGRRQRDCDGRLGPKRERERPGGVHSNGPRSTAFADTDTDADADADAFVAAHSRLAHGA